MNPYLELLRPSVCLMTVLALVIGGFVAGTFSTTLTFGLVLVAALLICGSGNVVNDYIDYKIDKISMPHRPIPSGRIKRDNALWLFAVTGLLGVIISWYVSTTFFAIAVFNFAVSTLYAYRLKKIILVKNIAVSYLAASSFLAAGFISGISIGVPLMLLVVISFLAAMSREVLKDIRDIRGDKAVQIVTLPLKFGERNAKMFALALLYLACLLLLVPSYYGLFSAYYWIGALPAVAVCIYASTQQIRKSEKLVKVATYLVFLGFLLGSIAI